MINSLKSKASYIIKLPTTKDILINTSGNYLNVFFAALYALIFVRVLNPSEYGVLSVLFAISYVLANVFDFGVTASIYSYLPILISKKEEAYSFIKTNFLYQAVLSGTAIFILSFLITPIDTYILKLNAPHYYYLLILLSVPLFIWLNYILNTLYAAKKFLQANIAINAANILKTAILGILIYMNLLTIETIIITLTIAGPLIFFFIIFLYNRHVVYPLIGSKIKRDKIKLRFTLTFFGATQIFNFATRIDLFLISFFLMPVDVGFYGLAQKIVSGVLTSITAVTQVLSPQFSKATTRESISKLMRKSYLYIMIPIVVYIAAILAPDIVYTIAFTKDFVRSANITRLLSTAYILYALISIPILFILYTIRRPVYLLAINIFFLLGVGWGSWMLIPILGVYGPPLAMFITLSLIGVYMIFLYKNEVSKIS